MKSDINFRMQKISLSAQLRDVATPLRDVRAARLVPAVVYGHKVAPISISLDASALLKAYRTAGKSHLLDLVVDGATHVAMMHDVQFHPVLGDIVHVDFFVVSATEKILVDLPVIFTGKSQAQLEGSTLQQNHTTLSVKVLPKDLIEAIEVDISLLVQAGDLIHVETVAKNYPTLEFITPANESVVSAIAAVADSTSAA